MQVRLHPPLPAARSGRKLDDPTSALQEQRVPDAGEREALSSQLPPSLRHAAQLERRERGALRERRQLPGRLRRDPFRARAREGELRRGAGACARSVQASGPRGATGACEGPAPPLDTPRSALWRRFESARERLGRSLRPPDPQGTDEGLWPPPLPTPPHPYSSSTISRTSSTTCARPSPGAPSTTRKQRTASGR